MNLIPFSNKGNTHPCFNDWFVPSSMSAIVVQFFLSCGAGHANMYSTLLDQLNQEIGCFCRDC